MQNQPLATVQEMFNAFGTGDLERFKKTVSEDSVWTCHGIHRIPKQSFKVEKALPGLSIIFLQPHR